MLWKVVRRGLPVKDVSMSIDIPAMSALPPILLPAHDRSLHLDVSVPCPRFLEPVPAA